MQTYNVDLESAVSETYRCVRAANALDIDVKKKSKHHLSIKADLESEFNIGLIVGNSGSGKTTLAKEIWGKDVFKSHLDLSLPVIDQFPKSMSYEDCVSMLLGVGLSSVPCWIRPAHTLSNGQKARAEAALAFSSTDEICVFDEWTSVVDRTVAKIMSHAVQKHSRREKKKIILCSCHYDVIDWLQPDWIIDCNRATFERRGVDRRSEKLTFDIKEVDRKTWQYFSKYHYLSDRLPGGFIRTFGLFHGENQVGFQCFANYTPHRQNKMIMHSNRTVIHPDYVGVGLGVIIIDETSKFMKKEGFRVMAKFSSIPIYKALMKSKHWILKKTTAQCGKISVGGNMKRQSGFRENVKTYSFEFMG